MIALLAPLVAQAVPAPASAPVFAPVLDRPVAFSVSETRQDGARTQRFAIDRQVTFRRAGDGFTAEVETLRVTGAPNGAGPLFEGMTRSMLGRRIVIRLNASGRATDVDDLDAIWDAQLQAMTGALAGKGSERAAMVDRLVAPLRSLPRAAKVKRVAEMLASLVVDRAYAPAGTRAITVPAQGPDGATTLLAGTERISSRPDRRLLLERRASGTVGSATRSLSLLRVIDVHMGMVIDTTAIETIETAGGRMIVTRKTRIESPVF